MDGPAIIDGIPGFRSAHALMGLGGKHILFSMLAFQIVATRN